MKPVLVFDMVGTLLDLSALDPLFERALGDSKLRREWFSEVLKIALATTAINTYVEFGKITEAALKVVEERYLRNLKSEERKQLLQSLMTLPAFPDVNGNLAFLRQAGFRLAVLTNSKPDVADQMLVHAGIRQHFDRVLSADSVQRLKPAHEAYQMAARELGVGMESVFLVAAHSWDIAGAIRAGCQGCFLKRPDEVLDELTPSPILVASDLRELALKLADLQTAK